MCERRRGRRREFRLGIRNFDSVNYSTSKDMVILISWLFGVDSKCCLELGIRVQNFDSVTSWFIVKLSVLEYPGVKVSVLVRE
jgi:hypothetical protein